MSLVSVIVTEPDKWQNLWFDLYFNLLRWLSSDYQFCWNLIFCHEYNNFAEYRGCYRPRSGNMRDSCLLLSSRKCSSSLLQHACDRSAITWFWVSSISNQMNQLNLSGLFLSDAFISSSKMITSWFRWSFNHDLKQIVRNHFSWHNTENSTNHHYFTAGDVWSI